MLKAVIDTNVFISALLNVGGKPRQLVDCLEASRFALFYPEKLLSELRKAPAKPRLTGKLTADQIERFIDLLERKGDLVTPKQIASVSRDPDDDVFIACALAAGADYLVTGDKDLLCLQQHGGIKIVLPVDFLQILTKG